MLHAITQIVFNASQLILHVHTEAEDISSKEGRANYVTKYDVQVQEYLYSHLSEILPEASFVGEESKDNPQIDSGYTFIIDPIDGTSNFIHDYHYSCISVALALNSQVILGVVYNPYTDELFQAERGKGSYLNGRRLSAMDLPMEQGFVSFGTSVFYPELTELTFKLAQNALEHSMDIRRVGSGALDICYIAAGRNLVFFELALNCWDYAAAWLVLEEAGGILTTMNGEPTDLNQKRSVLAGMPTAHREMLSLIQHIKIEGTYPF